MNPTCASPTPVVLPSPAELLQALRQGQPQTHLVPTTDPTQWLLQMGRMQVRLRWLNEPVRLEMAVNAGELPTDADEGMYKALLAYNSLSRRTRGTRVALESHSLEVLCDQPAGQCTARELQQALWHLVDEAHSAQIWMHVHLDQQLAAQGEHAPVH